MPAISSWREINVPVPVFHNQRSIIIANYRFHCRFPQGLDVLMTAFYAWMISCFVQNKGMADYSETLTAI